MLTASIFKSLGISLVLTLALESLWYLLVGVRGYSNFLLCLLINLLTNPPLVLCVLLMRLFFRGAIWPYTLCLECAAVLVEGLCLRAFGESIKRPYLLSLSANAFSYLSGLILSFLL